MRLGESMAWLIENKEWIFSGIGVSVIILIVSIFKQKPDAKQIQKTGTNSTNYQAGGNIHIGSSNDK